MESSKKIKLAVVAFLLIAGGLLVRFGAIAGSSLSTSGVNVSMPSAKTLQVFLNGETSKGVSLSDEDGEMSLGASTPAQTTYWTAGNFSGDLTVSGTSTFSGSASFAGLSVTGNVTTTSLVTDIVSSFTSVTTSQTLCSIRNTSGANRVLLRADFLYTTSTVTGGTNGFTISQSGTASATGTGSNVYFNNSAVTVPTDGLAAINGTSTLIGTGAVPTIWYAGNYINYLQMRPTSTLTGTCRVVSS